MEDSENLNRMAECKQIEELLKNSEEKYRQLFSLVAESIFLIDNQSGQILEVNEAATSLYGYSREELLTMMNTSLSAEPDQTRLATNSRLTCVPLRWHRKKNGTVFPVEIAAKHLTWHGRGAHIAAIRDITERREAENALMESEQRYRDIFENSSDCIFLIDVIKGQRFKCVMFNPAEEKAVGLKSEQVSGKFVEEIFNKELADKLNNNYRNCCLKGIPISYEEALELPSGLVYFNTSLIPIKDPEGRTVRIIGIARDITELKLKAKALENQNEFLQKMADTIRHRIALEEAIAQASRLFVSPMGTDLNEVLKIFGEIVSVSRAYIFRFREKGAKMDNMHEWCKVGTEPHIDNLQDLDSDIFPWWMRKLKQGENIVIPDVDGLPPAAAAEKEILQAQEIKSLLVVPIHATDGTLNGFLGFDDTEQCREWSGEDTKALRVAAEMVGVYWERKRAEEALQYLATHDALTGIPNRYYLEENLKRAAAKAQRGEKAALLFIDLDNFKLVNDTLGHKAGDELLIALVNVFKNNLREYDFLARLGGDEFAVLLEGINDQEAGAVAEKLRRAVCESELNLMTHRLRLNQSISIGIISIDGTLDYQRCLALADTALYAAKDGGRNRVVFAQPEDEPLNRLTETNHLLSVIKSALQEDRFVLHFQPVIRLSDRKIIHYEALIRLQDNNGQMIFPRTFIPAAERFGLMSQIDHWVVKSSLATMRKFPELKLFINLSGVTIGDETALGKIESSILESGIDPSRIGFEITETAAVKDLLRAERWICSLKKLGCQFALDDFGMGFSSFSYLRTLPVDYIKIDGSFVKNADKDPVHRAFIQAIYTIAKTLGKKTIAEFVENEDVFKVLGDIGIECGQGFYLGRPDTYQRNVLNAAQII